MSALTPPPFIHADEFLGDRRLQIPSQGVVDPGLAFDASVFVPQPSRDALSYSEAEPSGLAGSERSRRLGSWLVWLKADGHSDRLFISRIFPRFFPAMFQIELHIKDSFKGDTTGTMWKAAQAVASAGYDVRWGLAAPIEYGRSAALTLIVISRSDVQSRKLTKSDYYRFFDSREVRQQELALFDEHFTAREPALRDHILTSNASHEEGFLLRASDDCVRVIRNPFRSRCLALDSMPLRAHMHVPANPERSPSYYSWTLQRDSDIAAFRTEARQRGWEHSLLFPRYMVNLGWEIGPLDLSSVPSPHLRQLADAAMTCYRDRVEIDDKPEERIGATDECVEPASELLSDGEIRFRPTDFRHLRRIDEVLKAHAVVFELGEYGSVRVPADLGGSIRGKNEVQPSSWKCVESLCMGAGVKVVRIPRDWYPNSDELDAYLRSGEKLLGLAPGDLDTEF